MRAQLVGAGIVTGDVSRHRQFRAMEGAQVEASEREFERLYLESYPIVYNYVRVRIGDDADAEDIVAESFLNAARSFSSYDPTRAKFSTWVVAIARNCMISHHRKARQTVALDDVPDDVASTRDESEAVDDRLLADQLLMRLSDEEREIVLMRYREGYRNVDIAAIMGMSASTVATKLARALDKSRAPFA